ncbi:class I SAM-dependent methyltransferase [Streptomyces sp. TS71-3]|uniref:class I SAM-dependent DNA methyltransferase n=1 Tax=Streptomyces sp. TS71-3 TaxID=2733862 RepID=UPI00201720D0|nr:class I SAM-dependent methyltransferase [Streptomyces sp. TS71-3]
MFRPEVLDPAVDFLAARADGGPVLEFAVGTGRVALPLAARGLRVAGIELSEPMVAELRAKPAGAEFEVTVGDMATTRVPGEFALVYVVFNTISNLLSQDKQVECFRNAARHLRPGGRFAVEVFVPELRRLPPGETARPFHIGAGHVGFDTYDMVTQRLISHHYRLTEGRADTFLSHHRYVWPAELDLMARLAGLEPSERWEDWGETPFTAESRSHVSVWRKPEA